MNQTETLIESVYRNTQMGIETLSKLKDMDLDPELKETICHQYNEYSDIRNEAERMIEMRGMRKKKINPVAVVSARFTIGLKTLTDKSPARIAEMVMKGNANGLIVSVKNVRRLSAAEPEAKELAVKLITTEQNNFDELKNFLS